MLKNTHSEYGTVAKTLHWGIFVLVTGLLIVGLIMDGLPKPIKFQVYTVHKLTGLTVLLLMIGRLIWTIRNIKPDFPEQLATWEKRLAHGIHHLLYVLLIAMPLAGWAMSTASNHIPSLFGLAMPMPLIPESKPVAHFASISHTVLGYTLIAVILLHTLAALKHHFVNKDNVLKRMLPLR